MTYSTPDLSDAVREMHRRANRWGGSWIVTETVEDGASVYRAGLEGCTRGRVIRGPYPFVSEANE